MEEHERYKSFAQWLRDLMRRDGLTTQEVARTIAYSVNTIDDLLRGRQRPDRKRAERLADLFQLAGDERAHFISRACGLSPFDKRSGEQINATYRLGGLLGQGASGAVYRAQEIGAPPSAPPIVIKVIAAALVDRLVFIRDFEAEAERVQALNHPAVLPLRDAWRERDGAAYMVMPEARSSLQPLLASGGVPHDLLADLFDMLVASLAHAHAQGVVHGNIHPSNVLLRDDGRWALGDFRLVHELAARPPVGKRRPSRDAWPPVYLAPEQVAPPPPGKSRPRPTPAADIYGLATLVHTLIVGAPPQKHNDPNGDGTHPDGPLLFTAELPPALIPVLTRATALAPGDRYVDIETFAAAVRRALGLPMPDRIPGATVPAANPFKGLRAFQEADEQDFFGRAVLTADLLSCLAKRGEGSRLLAVVGPSGSGKSSVVRAGLLPALRRDAIPGSAAWFIPREPVIPGEHPWEAIEAALLRMAVNPPDTLLAQLMDAPRGLLRAVERVLPDDPAVELLLVIDQFEEVFTLVADEAVRHDLLASLYTAATDPRSRLRVVLTLRADFYDRPLQYADFGALVRRRTEVVLPLSTDELREAIHGPAGRASLQVEPALVEAMIADVGAQPGTLPLFQYALTELAEQPQDRTLTLAAYRSSGGVAGALAQRAEAIYEGLDATQQEAVRQLFLRLVTLGEGGEDTRRRVRRAELAGDDIAIDEVLQGYSAARLLTFDRDPDTRAPTVEVAHEALLRSWGRLRDWLDASRDALRVQQRLAAAAVEWMTAGRDPSYLAGGTRLAQFEALAVDGDLALNQEEQAYIAASVTLREEFIAASEMSRQRELAQAQELAEEQRRRAEEQARAAHRLRRRAIYLGVALILAILAGVGAGLAGVVAGTSHGLARTVADREYL